VTVEHATFIGAPPEVVWRVTTDVERWPEWTPTVTSVKKISDGALGPGSAVRLKQPGQPESTWVVTVFEPGNRFAWETRRTGLRMVGSHEISVDGEGTRNVLRVDAEGAMALLLWPALRLAFRRALKQENDGLKAFCEKSPAP
jgi:uncharacterized protein YndB with AHSA1/START domain